MMQPADFADRDNLAELRRLDRCPSPKPHPADIATIRDWTMHR